MTDLLSKRGQRRHSTNKSAKKKHVHFGKGINYQARQIADHALRNLDRSMDEMLTIKSDTSDSNDDSDPHSDDSVASTSSLDIRRMFNIEADNLYEQQIKAEGVHLERSIFEGIVKSKVKTYVNH